MKPTAYTSHLLLAALVSIGLPTSLYGQPLPPQQKPWDAPEWKQCLQRFTKTAKPGLHPKEQRLINGECLPRENSKPVPDGQCFMEAVSPSDLLSATRFEVKLVCANRRMEVMVCTNKKGHYMDAMISGMRNDPRCEGFPDLLAVDMKKKGPNKALDAILGPDKKNTPECKVQVRKVKRLENDPLFDANRNIRRLWSYEMSVSEKMGCTL